MAHHREKKLAYFMCCHQCHPQSPRSPVGRRPFCAPKVWLRCSGRRPQSQGQSSTNSLIDLHPPAQSIDTPPYPRSPASPPPRRVKSAQCTQTGFSASRRPLARTACTTTSTGRVRHKVPEVRVMAFSTVPGQSSARDCVTAASEYRLQPMQGPTCRAQDQRDT